MDINKVWLSGTVIKQPVLTRLSGKLPICTFIMQVNEQFINKSDKLETRPNIIKMECLGKNAERTSKAVKPGRRYTVDGYLRQDFVGEVSKLRVRIFAIFEDESIDHVNHKEGLKQAFDILKNSVNRESALEKIGELIKKEK